MSSSPRCLAVAFPLLLVACTPTIDSGSNGDKVSSTDESLSGCHGQASSTIPASGNYYLTSFGGYGESQVMSCGEKTKNGSWYYMASRQRFGCGAHVKLTANGNCVVAEADDYGPDVCVERAAGMPIIDASPKVALALFGANSAGWSDHLEVTAEEVDASTPLGLCSDAVVTSDPTAPTTPPTDTTPDPSATCASYTLGTDVPAGQCVQSTTDDHWYQCTGGGWVRIGGPDVDGPLGACTAEFPLN